MVRQLHIFVFHVVCVYPTGHNSTATFTKLHTQVSTGLGRN